MKDKLQEYALISEIIGGIGIIASLIFVGFQVKQNAEETALNTRQMQSDAYTQLSINITNINRDTLDHPELIAIQQKVANGDPLTDTEQALRLASRRIVFRYADLAWNQFDITLPLRRISFPP